MATIRSKAILCAIMTLVIFAVVGIYLQTNPTGAMSPKDSNVQDFMRQFFIALSCVNVVLSVFVLLAIWYRRMALLLAMVIVQGVFFKISVILTVVLLLSLIRVGEVKQRNHEARIFCLCVLLVIVWLVLVLEEYNYWVLLNDIKSFPIYQRLELEARGGRPLEIREIDFDTVSMKEFDALQSFGMSGRAR